MRAAKINVDVIDFTGAGTTDPEYRAARLMAFTKNTRLQMTPDGWQRFLDMPMNELLDEIRYISRTIPTAWEFVDVTFSIQEISRACAQQITRTRYTPMDVDIFGSYQMQSQRVTDMSGMPMHVPENLSDDQKVFRLRDGHAMMAAYDASVKAVGVEDSRGLLPMDIGCNLVAKYSLRALSELCRKRTSLRVGGEFNEVVRQMRELVEAQWPWVAPFFEPKDKTAIDIIEEVAAGLPHDQKMQLAKAADLIKV